MQKGLPGLSFSSSILLLPINVPFVLLRSFIESDEPVIIISECLREISTEEIDKLQRESKLESDLEIYLLKCLKVV